jgi:hypothetical protein
VFKDGGSMHAVKEGIPTFKNTTGITILSTETDVKDLYICKELKELVLRRPGDFIGELELDHIWVACESVERLSLHGFRFHGTLEKLEHLRELSLGSHTCTNLPQEEPRFFFPLASINTLTHLTIDTSDHETFVPEPYDPTPLQQFVNLTSLHVAPLFGSLIDVIIESQFSLISFKTSLDRKFLEHQEQQLVTPQKLVAFFRATCFRPVEHIDIQGTDADDIEMLPSLVAITDNLRLIQEATFGMGLTEECLPVLPRLANLRKLTWVLWNGDDFFTSDHLEDEMAEVYGEMGRRDLVKVVLLSAFNQVVNTPEVVVYRDFTSNYCKENDFEDIYDSEAEDFRFLLFGGKAEDDV